MNFKNIMLAASMLSLIGLAACEESKHGVPAKKTVDTRGEKGDAGATTAEGITPSATLDEDVADAIDGVELMEMGNYIIDIVPKEALMAEDSMPSDITVELSTYTSLNREESKKYTAIKYAIDLNDILPAATTFDIFYDEHIEDIKSGKTLRILITRNEIRNALLRNLYDLKGKSPDEVNAKVLPEYILLDEQPELRVTIVHGAPDTEDSEIKDDQEYQIYLDVKAQKPATYDESLLTRVHIVDITNEEAQKVNDSQLNGAEESPHPDPAAEIELTEGEPLLDQNLDGFGDDTTQAVIIDSVDTDPILNQHIDMRDKVQKPKGAASIDGLPVFIRQ